MDHDSQEYISASTIILFASVVFTLVAFATFKGLWDITIPIPLLFTVLGLQFATLALGRSKILTQIGAASLSALIAIAATLGAVFFFFPPFIELRIAGFTGSVLALVFIIASFVAASREDPVSSTTSRSLIFDAFKNVPESELVKYGEVQTQEIADSDRLPLTDTSWEGSQPEEKPDAIESEWLTSNTRTFDTMEDVPTPDDSDSKGDTLTKPEDETLVTTLTPGQKPELDSPEMAGISEDWVEETARVMAYDGSGELQGSGVGSPGAGRVDSAGKTTGIGTLPDFNMRTRFKVIDALSGVHYGTYFGDEGYSTLDPVSLAGLLNTRLPEGELRITKLDWSNFDEVEVHIQVEEILPIDLDESLIEAIEDNLSQQENVGEVSDDSPEITDLPLPDEFAKKIMKEDVPKTPSGSQYFIYDRRTMQRMGEYTPTGERSRIDRLTLYRMFPEYDFKTFEIDSIRWEGSEVRIFVRGEKKRSSRSRVQNFDKNTKQQKLQDES